MDSPASAGTHRLLRQGAILIRGVEDILEELQSLPAGIAPPPAPSPPEMDAVQQRIWEFLQDQPRHMDEIAQQLRLSIPEITGALVGLEMKKAVRRLPGNHYERG
jgi:DNA processing protein